ncbi:aminodeoxychorismate synthase component I [Pseudonocardia lutea]|uniref:Aminodeoxychorismate synthase component I n=1 Tax=Pseudonocardia lutea TaxID=2172015 RepID=A0ABW1I9D9_9PSEU
MSTPPGPWARFDDLVAGAAVRFAGVDRVVTATRLDEVATALNEVDEQTHAGKWAFGFVAYEAAAGLDPDLVGHDPVDGLPLVWFGVVDQPERVPVVAPGAPVPPRTWSPAWDAPTHRHAVERVRERIAAGATYQCNLTTRLHAAPVGDAEALYRELALGQRGAHNAYLDLGRFTVASASPELFFEQRGETILMRPMKGTAARGRTTAEDTAAVAALRGSAKERAENVMIVDLVRNDLSRIAEPGSVAVPRLLAAERYETVHQLTSDVTAQLRPGVGLTEIFRALFPCGSVTGAPKARTMELIRDLEDGPRGVYCGAIGIVGPPDASIRARFSVAIRTVEADRARDALTYGAGGGITWSSEPAAEYAELLAKSRVLAARHEEFELIETMRHRPGEGVRNLDAHLARLADSAGYFGFRFDEAAARGLLAARLTGAGPARVRLRCSRDGTLAVDLEPLPDPGTGPVRLAVDTEPIDSTSCWPHHKTSRRAPYLDRLRRHPDADDVVLVNERGEVTETCTATLAAHLGGRWWTPPLGSGCLPGVERGRLLAVGLLRERVLFPDDLAEADRLVLVSSLRGQRPAVLAPLQVQDLPTAPPLRRSA